ncbi:hypothetical protein KCP77_14050 [Salmonella enterica subsp. enterica]|nr:hypothetical protein KCP77_14050 [Salmonella enterica subsp. enterica]
MSIVITRYRHGVSGQASKIRITAMPVSGLSGLVTLMATVDSRYPIARES